MTRRFSRRAIAIALSALVVGVSMAAGLLWSRVRTPYRGYSAPEVFVDIPPGLGTQSIGRRLVAAGVVADRVTFRLAAWAGGAARHLKAGEYRFDRPMSPLDVVRKLARGDVYTRLLTFPEGLTIAEMARRFEVEGFGPAASFAKAARNSRLIAHLDPEAPDLEGYLFPETYSLPRGTPASRVVHLMVERFAAILGPDLRRAAAAQGLSVRQVVTLASLVEKETAQPHERPVVAAVYLNRLAIGMGLQCDPTVIFALERAGRYTGDLSRSDLDFDSPYNTYRHTGLPPGPIAAPGRAALEAAVRPAAVDYLYFVSRNDGSHEFARTLAEHNRNVHNYQVRYFRQQR